MRLSYDLMRSPFAGEIWLAVWDGDSIYDSIELDFVKTIEFFLKAQLANEESEGKRDFGQRGGVAAKLYGLR